MEDYKIKDRQDEIEWLRMAANCVGVGISYRMAEKIHHVQKLLSKKGGKTTLDEYVKLECKLDEKWMYYCKEAKEATSTEE